MVREPIVAGILYPSESTLLRKSVQRLLMDSTTLSSRAKGLMLPYAHYDSVGALIAAGMKRISSSAPKRIILLAAPTTETPQGLFLPAVTAFGTPLGRLPVDSEAIALLEAAGATRDDLLHLQEHALEPHLPFLAHLFPNVPILPLLLRVNDLQELKLVTATLGELGPEYVKEAVIIVSSNTSSYSEIREAGWESRRFIGAALTHDATRLMQGYHAHLVSGAGPLALLCNLLPQEATATILGRSSHHTYHSGVTFSVEYASIVFDLPS